MKKPRSLSFYVSIWLGVAVAIGMTVYATIQHLTSPEQSLQELFLSYGWHVLALGGIFYIVSWLVFDRLLVRPLNSIYVYLYAIGGGERSPSHMKSKVAEIDLIVDGIGVMLRRLDQSEEATRHALAEVAALRQRIEKMDAAPAGEKTKMLAEVTALETSTRSLRK